MWSSSSSITCSTASVYPDESSTITGPNSSAKHSNDSVTNSESKVCHQRFTIQPLMTLHKPSIRLLGSFSRIRLEESTWLGWQIKRILMGLPHNGENPDESHVIFLGVRMWSCTLTRNLDPISASCLNNQDGRRENVSIAPPAVWSFRWQTSTSLTANWALSSLDF